ncbi:hypothetical protein FV218_10335 [Methylobacterium sp. WL69]|uniref:hypothetical protein n=1 Tax=Methylobacterium sp. WL69 TaxID=2603893 RepID=UPI0011C9143E|nr:hypothetical protein [Methylobacterium sp. WL69]TXM74196.1 hypothetical protein FV218_10335 [Methylobacterium sp. WL69]
MDETEILHRLDAQDRLLHAIVAALAPQDPEEETSGFDDLLSALVELTVAVSDTAQSVALLRSHVSGLSRPLEAPSSAAA